MPHTIEFDEPNTPDHTNINPGDTIGWSESPDCIPILVSDTLDANYQGTFTFTTFTPNDLYMCAIVAPSSDVQLHPHIKGSMARQPPAVPPPSAPPALPPVSPPLWTLNTIPGDTDPPDFDSNTHSVGFFLDTPHTIQFDAQNTPGHTDISPGDTIGWSESPTCVPITTSDALDANYQGTFTFTTFTPNDLYMCVTKSAPGSPVELHPHIKAFMQRQPPSTPPPAAPPPLSPPNWVLSTKPGGTDPLAGYDPNQYSTSFFLDTPHTIVFGGTLPDHTPINPGDTIAWSENPTCDPILASDTLNADYECTFTFTTFTPNDVYLCATVAPSLVMDSHVHIKANIQRQPPSAPPPTAPPPLDPPLWSLNFVPGDTDPPEFDSNIYNVAFYENTPTTIHFDEPGTAGHTNINPGDTVGWSESPTCDPILGSDTLDANYQATFLFPTFTSNDLHLCSIVAPFTGFFQEHPHIKGTIVHAPPSAPPAPTPLLPSIVIGQSVEEPRRSKYVMCAVVICCMFFVAFTLYIYYYSCLNDQWARQKPGKQQAGTSALLGASSADVEPILGYKVQPSKPFDLHRASSKATTKRGRARYVAIGESSAGRRHSALRDENNAVQTPEVAHEAMRVFRWDIAENT